MKIGKPNIQGYEHITVTYAPRHDGDLYPWVRLGAKSGRRWHQADIREVEHTPEFKLGTDSVRTGEGTSSELALAATVAIAVAKYFREPRDSFFVAGHEHEQLPKGSASVAWEGGLYDWPYLWAQTPEAGLLARELDVHFDAINGCILAVLQGSY